MITSTVISCLLLRIISGVLVQNFTVIENNCKIGLRIYQSCDSTEFEDFCIDEAEDLFRSEYYDGNICTVLIGVPFMNDVEHMNVNNVVRALASRCAYNILVLDNSEHTFLLPWQYDDAVLHVYKDALLYATVLDQAMDEGVLRSDCLMGVGHSLAANTLGHVCRLMRHSCQVLYAIDPAGPGFRPPRHDTPPANQLVSQQDACHVVYMQCNLGRIGTEYHLGHVNIVLNNGLHQPSCQRILKWFIFGYEWMCSHRDCNSVFAKAVESPGSCLAKQCDPADSLLGGQCDAPGYHLDLPPDKRYKCTSEPDIREPEIFFMDTTADSTCY